MLVDTLRSTGHEVVDISLKQVDAFCGNVLEVENYYGKPVLAMSTQAVSTCNLVCCFYVSKTWPRAYILEFFLHILAVRRVHARPTGNPLGA